MASLQKAPSCLNLWSRAQGDAGSLNVLLWMSTNPVFFIDANVVPRSTMSMARPYLDDAYMYVYIHGISLAFFHIRPMKFLSSQNPPVSD